MLSVSSLIDFLMNLLRDEAAQAEFERDPQGMLARHGLEDLCGQDVRDAAPMLADQEGVYVRSGSQHAAPVHHGGDDDPVRVITHIKEHYTVNAVVNHSETYSVTHIDDRDTIVTVDDRDTTTITAEGDVTVTDSFNSDTEVTVTQIEDSFNQDNDGVDNKGGVINDSAVAGDDIDDSFNETDNSVNDSHNADESYNTDGSYNTDDDGADVTITTDEGSADIDSSTAEEPVDAEPVDAEPVDAEAAA